MKDCFESMSSFEQMHEIIQDAVALKSKVSKFYSSYSYMGDIMDDVIDEAYKTLKELNDYEHASRTALLKEYADLLGIKQEEKEDD